MYPAIRKAKVTNMLTGQVMQSAYSKPPTLLRPGQRPLSGRHVQPLPPPPEEEEDGPSVVQQSGFGMPSWGQWRNPRFGGFRAKGGPVKKGVAYMVGEKGPEMIVPNDDSKVVSHAKLKQIGRRMRKHRKAKKDKNGKCC